MDMYMACMTHDRPSVFTCRTSRRADMGDVSLRARWMSEGLVVSLGVCLWPWDEHKGGVGVHKWIDAANQVRR